MSKNSKWIQELEKNNETQKTIKLSINSFLFIYLSLFIYVVFIYLFLFSLYVLKMTSTYIIADCHDAIKDIDTESIELIYFNPPFATTHKPWDKPLNWSILFNEMDRVLRENGILIIHCAIPFTYELIQHRTPNYHYSWVKGRPTGHLNAKKQPLRNVEEILIYYKNPQHTYHPQMRGTSQTYKKRENPKNSEYYKSQKTYITNHTGKYPTTFLGEFKYVSQKNSPKSVPDYITRFIMKTYSNEGDTILDLTCCDKNNGNIAMELGRFYIGIDIDDKYLKN